MEFFQTTRQYRIAVEEAISYKSAVGKGQAHTATLQGVPQGGQEGTANPKIDQGAGNPKNAKDGRNRPDQRSDEEKYEGRKCLCGEMHLFQTCP